MTTAGRRIRAASVLAVAALTLFGTRYSQDEAFPFGPMSMFAFRTTPDGSVSVASLRGTVDGAANEIALPAGSFGLRRAEVEGSMGRMRGDPTLIGELVAARERLRPDLPRLTSVRIVQTEYLLRHGQRTGVHEATVAQWRR